MNRKPASTEEIISAFSQIIKANDETNQSRELIEFRCSFKATTGLHVLIRQATKDPALRSVPAMYTHQLISPLPDHLDNSDYEWMLNRATDAFRAAHLNLDRIDRRMASIARKETLDSLPIEYHKFRDCLLEMVGFLQVASSHNFNPEAYLVANDDVRAAANGDIQFAMDHFRVYGYAENRKQRIFPFEGESSKRWPVQFEGPIRVGFSTGATIPLGVHFSDRTVPKIEIIEHAQRHNSNSSFDYSASQGSGLPQFDLLAGTLEWTSPVLTFAHFKGATASLENGFLTCGSHFWSDSCFATLLCPGGRTRSLDFFELDGEYFRLAEDLHDKPLEFEGEAMIFCSWASRANYGHWLMNSLLSVYLARERIQAGHLNLICAPLTERQRADLLMLGVPAHAIVETSYRYVRGDILYPSPLTTQANMLPGLWAEGFFSDLRDRANFKKNIQSPRLLYISRQGFHASGRLMANEAVLVERLAKLGFRCIKPHELNFPEQIQWMSSAEIIVGQFGAALWNLSFAPSGGVFVEIGVDSYSSNEYLYLAHIKGFRFIRVMTNADMDPTEAARGAAFSFEAPIDAILAIVSKLL